MPMPYTQCTWAIMNMNIAANCKLCMSSPARSSSVDRQKWLLFLFFFLSVDAAQNINNNRTARIPKQPTAERQFLLVGCWLCVPDRSALSTDVQCYRYANLIFFQTHFIVVQYILDSNACILFRFRYQSHALYISILKRFGERIEMRTAWKIIVERASGDVGLQHTSTDGMINWYHVATFHPKVSVSASCRCCVCRITIRMARLCNVRGKHPNSSVSAIHRQWKTNKKRNFEKKKNKIEITLWLFPFII